MQVTSKPSFEPEKRKAYLRSEMMQKMAESARYDWPGLASADVVVFKQAQRARAGDSPQPVPTIFVAPTRSAAWTFSGLAENGLAPGRIFTWPALEWRGLKQTVSCAGLIVLMLLLLRAIEHYKPFLRIRTRRARAHARLLVACHLQRPGQEKKGFWADSAAKTGDLGGCDLPPTYFEFAEGGEKGAPRGEGDSAPPRSTLFENLHTFQQKAPDGEAERGPRASTVYIDMPYPGAGGPPRATPAPDDSGRAANVVIAINTLSSVRPCIIDFNVKLNKTSGKLEVTKNATTPVDIQVDQLGKAPDAPQRADDEPDE